MYTYLDEKECRYKTSSRLPVRPSRPLCGPTGRPPKKTPRKTSDLEQAKEAFLNAKEKLVEAEIYLINTRVLTDAKAAPPEKENKERTRQLIADKNVAKQSYKSAHAEEAKTEAAVIEGKLDAAVTQAKKKAAKKAAKKAKSDFTKLAITLAGFIAPKVADKDLNLKEAQANLAAATAAVANAKQVYVTGKRGGKRTRRR